MSSSTGNAVMDNLNFIRILQDGLSKQVKKQLTEKLISDELVAYELRLREIIEPMVNEITFDSINTLQTFDAVRQDLRLYIKWADKEPDIREFTDKRGRS